MSKRLLFAFWVCLGFIPKTVFCQGLETGRGEFFPPRAFSSSSTEKDEVKNWFASMGIDTAPGYFAGDLYRIMAGIEHPLGDSMGITVSAGHRFRFGINF